MRVVKRVMVIVLAAVVLSVGVGAAVAAHHGYRMYAVRTGSMYPAYPAGTLIVDAPPTTAEIPAGSVVTFRVGNELVTHRVVDMSAAGLTTKGDANRTPDAWTVPQASIVGRVVTAVPHGGYVLVFLRQPTGSLGLMGGILSLILLWRLFFRVDDADPAVTRPERSRSRRPGEPSVA